MSAAESVDTVGFWLGFILVFVISAVESAASIIWTRFRVSADGIHQCELSSRVCGRELRFNPNTGLEAPAGLVDNVKDLARFGKGKPAGRALEHAVHLLVGLTDVSLGVARLALNSGSPQKLYDTLKDPTAPMTFESYLTLFLLYWLLGALLLICILPLHSKREGIDIRVARDDSPVRRGIGGCRPALLGMLEDRLCETARHAVDAHVELLDRRRERC
ncbi:hypothetical protein C8A03DRAFT_33796 [Achaetomium macrosporum]|uniref:Uncharacterized protein n=1 Tax=Achaetomium macrosporum TaxID=79813 RepID=A0AAN7CA24_9PEZI|nr:hypothetical protein C8A03DRAFT_33796 [Achaetomium macrosporum]